MARPGFKHAALALMCWAGLATTPVAFAETHTIHLPPGDTTSLYQALTFAATLPPEDDTVIVLNGTYVLTSTQPTIVNRVTIQGGAETATFRANDDSPRILFEVDSQGTLRVSNLEITGFELLDSLFVNFGRLEFDRVQFSKNESEMFCHRFGCSGAGQLVLNEPGGSLLINRTSIVDSCSIGGSVPGRACVVWNRGQVDVRNSQIYFSGARYNPPFFNTGTLRIENISVYTRNWNLSSGLTRSSGITEISSSVISGFDTEWCNDVISLGHNLVEGADCSFNAEGDITGSPADLLWVPVEADWNPGGKQILTHALVPQADSFAVDSGSAENCALGSLVTSQRPTLDGNGDGTAACDRGATERVPSTVAKGGVNGLYYNPNSDGHYVYIADTTFNTMVMWTTFDQHGEQAWIFGIGPRVGANGQFVADAYINRDGRVRLDGTLEPAESIPWGTLQVRMASCNEGRLTFSSDQPGFGSGQFQFRRLAYVDQIGCVEGP